MKFIDINIFVVSIISITFVVGIIFFVGIINFVVVIIEKLGAGRVY